MNSADTPRPVTLVSACMTTDGLPTFALTEVEVTQDDREKGLHYRLADQRVADMLELADGLLERNADHVAACYRIPAP